MKKGQQTGRTNKCMSRREQEHRRVFSFDRHLSFTTLSVKSWDPGSDPAGKTSHDQSNDTNIFTYGMTMMTCFEGETSGNERFRRNVYHDTKTRQAQHTKNTDVHIPDVGNHSAEMFCFKRLRQLKHCLLNQYRLKPQTKSPKTSCGRRALSII